jgi:membrane-associated phospholipid phosphatase
MFKLIEPIDSKLVKYIHLHRYKGADEFLMWLTEHATLIVISMILLLFIIYFIKKEKKILYIASNYSVILIIAALVTASLKLLIKRERPYDIYHELTAMVSGGGYSFPSGHTTEVFALATATFLMIKNKYIRTFTLLWAVIIAYTRMAMGVHYPGDVLGGVIIGSSVAYLWLRKNPFKFILKK